MQLVRLTAVTQAHITCEHSFVHLHTYTTTVDKRIPLSKYCNCNLHIFF